ncbi:MAG: ribonuclease HII [Treponema sp.]|nr:ribonuclease HII [Treponema sp.]
MLICGIDEAGRGPLAGPVVAAAVILPDDFPFEILKDSKKLSEKKRYAAESIIKEKSLAWAVASVEHDIIDEINILQASLLAMKNAFAKMMLQITLNNSHLSEEEIVAIVDGNNVPDIPVCVSAKPKADAIEHPVMAASILAKTERDRIMENYDKIYPEYNYAQHKGYPTKAHREICHKIGMSPIQRTTFKY